MFGKCIKSEPNKKHPDNPRNNLAPEAHRSCVFLYGPRLLDAPAFLRLRRDTLRSHALEGLGFGVQSGLYRRDEATLSLFVAVLFVPVLWMARHE